MDNFINLGKQYLENHGHSNSQEQVSKTGGHEYNSPDNRPPPGYGGDQSYSSGQSHSRPHFNDDEVVNTASREGSGDSSLFSSALSFLSNNKDEHERPIDEHEVQNAHRKAYDEDKPSDMNASSLGSAAAMQVLKKFTSGGSSESSHSSSKESSSGGTSQLISMAMAEASKLFDKSGGASSGNKQDAVNSAAMTVMKLLVQSKFKQTTGGSDSGGLSSLMGLASKFM